MTDEMMSLRALVEKAAKADVGAGGDVGGDFFEVELHRLGVGEGQRQRRAAVHPVPTAASDRSRRLWLASFGSPPTAPCRSGSATC